MSTTSYLRENVIVFIQSGYKNYLFFCKHWWGLAYETVRDTHSADTGPPLLKNDKFKTTQTSHR